MGIIVQLKVISGKSAGSLCNARRFPVRIGRAQESDLLLQDDGVWDRHLVVEFDPAVGFVLKTEGDAIAWVNNKPLEKVALRNGDIVTVGSSKFQFWIGEAQQSGLGLREALTWAGIIGVSLSQLLLILWLIVNGGSALPR